LLRLDPTRYFARVERSARWGRPDITTRLRVDGKVVNQCQKPVDMLR
jgi:hypothetical protein